MEAGSQLRKVFVKSSFSCKIPGITQFTIVIPGISKSDIGNDIPSIPSNEQGKSNLENRYTKYVKNK